MVAEINNIHDSFGQKEPGKIICFELGTQKRRIFITGHVHHYNFCDIHPEKNFLYPNIVHRQGKDKLSF